MALAPTRICIPRNRIATQSSEFATNVSGAQFAAYSFGEQDFGENSTNSVSISFNPDDFDQFTLGAALTPAQTPTFVAALTAGEFRVLQEQQTVYRWGYANTNTVNDGIVIASGDVSREALLTENESSELLFDSSVDWVGTEVTQSLKVGANFSNADTIVIYYTSSPTSDRRTWSVIRSNVAPLLTGGFSNNAIQTLSDNSFRITTGANSVLTDSALDADPPTQAFVIYAG